MLEVESGLPLKSIKTDMGGEYDSHEWTKFAKSKGFKHELTGPYNPEQNGICERLNRTLLEKMRCLLLWSGLPKSYWDVAVLHANGLRNRSPTAALQGKKPSEVWSNKKVRYQDSHTFGCLVQYLKVGHDRDPKSAKFASRTAYGVFLGMAAGQAGYRIFDPLRAGLIVRTDVRFYDFVPGYPRLMGKTAAAQPLSLPSDEQFFKLFPCEETDEPAVPAAHEPAVPAAHEPAVPAAYEPVQPHQPEIIELSESGVNDIGGADEEEEVQGGGEDAGVEDQSIADRVMARRRVNFAEFGDVC